ncbi:hypothetical protein [Paenibacillus agricola]|uniref:Uncharacterized protein n=1 Tax=Paenibacillus agricola TaxID=2716264 RepID=A0ABX0JH93_9BACL|nr:hypothetical protein [Paenibacillus agricola]NHN34654.1 hypothetical protein [Paenibacillus agricola]
MGVINEIKRLEEKQVSFVRLAGNSLIIYLECLPGETDIGASIWLEPTWHFRSLNKVITGSRQAQTDDKEEHEVLSQKLGNMVMKRVKCINIENGSNDLTLELDDGFSVKTFVSDPTDEESWHVLDHEQKVKIIGNPEKIILENVEDSLN